jgi:hypothetical protein
VVGIVKGVQKIFMEGMYVLEARESIENGLEFFAKGFRGEFDFSSVKA